MVLILTLFFNFFSYSNESIQDIIDALQIKNSEEIIKFFDKNGEININNNIKKGSNYKLIKALDDFYFNNDIKVFKEIHKGNSENNLTYILGEYTSNSDIYKVLVLIHNQDDIQKIIKIKIDIEK
tara:strand:+ start:1868 stop:2242 length:375 start_codon:yes stop_codon:yes gene_type:complete